MTRSIALDAQFPSHLLRRERAANPGPGIPFGSKKAETDWLLFAAKTTVSF